MNEYERVVVVLNAVEDVLDELRDRDDPAREPDIESLEDLHAELIARLESFASA